MFDNNKGRTITVRPLLFYAMLTALNISSANV